MAGEIQLNSVTLATESGGTISLSGDVDTTTPTKTALNASGSAPIYACRAWVNFNGTGTVAIRASGNVSSITDNGTGNYTVNFTTAMSDVNYSICGAGNQSTGTTSGYATMIGCPQSYQATSSVRVWNASHNGTGYDGDCIRVNIFR